MPPSRNILLAAGTREEAIVRSLIQKREIQAIMAHSGAKAELMIIEVKTNMGRFIIKQIRIQCPSLIVASDVYNALLVEAARPESLPKFTLEYGPESTTP